MRITKFQSFSIGVGAFFSLVQIPDQIIDEQNVEILANQME